MNEQLSLNEIENLWKELELKAMEGDCDRVNEILELNLQKIPKKNLNAALRAAVKGCNTKRLEDCVTCVESLIAANANVNAEESEEGRTALMLACEKGYLEVVQKLIELGALVDHRDKKKRTALFYAIENTVQNSDVVQELITKKANVNPLSIYGMSPLLVAAEKRHYQIITILL